MNRTICLKFGGAGLVMFLITAPIGAQAPNPSFVGTPNASTSDDPLHRAVLNYRTWTKLNEIPARMDQATAVACAPFSAHLESEKKHGPHGKHFVAVYVNDFGRSAVVNATPKFAVGSILIKEKLKSSATDTSQVEAAGKPVLLTAMVKRESGYDPEHGDWEYLTLTGDAQQITSRGKLENCRQCHDAKKGADFVYLNYLTRRDFDRLQQTSAGSTK